MVYEKRHRKYELAEKKLKNRERERLAYERYQQQLAVDKLRNMEMNRLIPIAALRHEGASSSSSSSNTLDASGLEVMHRKLLREAEDTLKRYDELGLGGKKRMTEINYNNISSGNTTESETKKPRRNRRESLG